MSIKTDIKYQDIKSKLMQEFTISNEMALPYVEKIIINASITDAISNKDVIKKVSEELEIITSQKPKIAKARQSISNFKLRQGDPLGLMVTLRGQRAINFLTNLISIVIPRFRDFRGVSDTKFDKFGNYNLGITEQILFPEIDYSKIDKIRGLVVTIVLKNSNPEKSKKYLQLMGLPFQEKEKN